MKNNIVKDKSFDFAIRIVKLHQYLWIEKKEFLNLRIHHRIQLNQRMPKTRRAERTVPIEEKNWFLGHKYL